MSARRTLVAGLFLSSFISTISTAEAIEIPYADAQPEAAARPTISWPGDGAQSAHQEPWARSRLCAGDPKIWRRLDEAVARADSREARSLVAGMMTCTPSAAACSAMGERALANRRQELALTWWLALTSCGPEVAPLFEKPAAPEDALLSYFENEARPWSNRLARLVDDPTLASSASRARRVAASLAQSRDPRAPALVMRLWQRMPETIRDEIGSALATVDGAPARERYLEWCEKHPDNQCKVPAFDSMTNDLARAFHEQTILWALSTEVGRKAVAPSLTRCAEAIPASPVDEDALWLRCLRALAVVDRPRAVTIAARANKAAVRGTARTLVAALRKTPREGDLAAWIRTRWGAQERLPAHVANHQITLFELLEHSRRAQWFDASFYRAANEESLFMHLVEMARPALDDAQIEIDRGVVQVYLGGKRWQWTAHLRNSSLRKPEPYEFSDVIGFVNTLLKAQKSVNRCAVVGKESYVGIACGPEAALREASALGLFDAP